MLGPGWVDVSMQKGGGANTGGVAMLKRRGYTELALAIPERRAMLGWVWLWWEEAGPGWGMAMPKRRDYSDLALASPERLAMSEWAWLCWGRRGHTVAGGATPRGEFFQQNADWGLLTIQHILPLHHLLLLLLNIG